MKTTNGFCTTAIAMTLGLTAATSSHAAIYVGSYSNKVEAAERGYVYREYNFAAPRGVGKHYIVYHAARPEFAYFYNPESGKYWGRCDLTTGKYALLPEKCRAARVCDVPEESFLPPGEMPPPQAGMNAVRMLPPPECAAKNLPPAVRQFYTAWVHDPAKQRFVCSFYFKANAADPSFKRQTVVCYTDPEKRGHFYYFNEDKQSFWGRCANKHHDAFNANISQWERRSEVPGPSEWTPLPQGDVPIPGARDGVALRVPDPPF